MVSEELHDFVNQADQVLGRYALDFVLSPPLLDKIHSNPPPLSWHSVPHGEEHKQAVPDNKRGVYAFVIATPAAFLPVHGYVCYIGMSGKDSNRPLRARYGDYFQDRLLAKRPRVVRMLARWEQVLRFFFAPVPDTVTSDEIHEMEKALNDAFQPPFSRTDYSAEVRELRKAF